MYVHVCRPTQTHKERVGVGEERDREKQRDGRTERVRERQRDRETETERQRQRERESHRDRDRNRDRGTERERERQRETGADRARDRETERKTRGHALPLTHSLLHSLIQREHTHTQIS